MTSKNSPRQKDLGIATPGVSSGRFASAGHDEAAPLSTTPATGFSPEIPGYVREVTPEGGQLIMKVNTDPGDLSHDRRDGPTIVNPDGSTEYCIAGVNTADPDIYRVEGLFVGRGHVYNHRTNTWIPYVDGGQGIAGAHHALAEANDPHFQELAAAGTPGTNSAQPEFWAEVNAIQASLLAPPATALTGEETVGWVFANSFCNNFAETASQQPTHYTHFMVRRWLENVEWRSGGQWAGIIQRLRAIDDDLTRIEGQRDNQRAA